MSKSPLPMRTLLPKGENLVCPNTVKQDMLQTVQSYGGPALISPDITICREAPHGSALLYSLPSLSGTSSQQQSPGPVPTFGRKEGPISPEIQLLMPRSVLKPKGVGSAIPPPPIPHLPSDLTGSSGGGSRLNKFVRRLHDMLQAEKDSGIVEWRRGLLVLHSTDAFAKTILPKYFNTRNFKTFRRQLNYYGFVHVRSFSTTGSTTTALWVNRDLAQHGSAEISSVLMLKRVEPCEAAKTAEGRRARKEQAIYTVEEDIGVSPRSLQMEQIRSLALRAGGEDVLDDSLLPSPKTVKPNPPVPTEVFCHFSMTLPPLFPKLTQLTTRQVSPVEHSITTSKKESDQAASTNSQTGGARTLEESSAHNEHQPVALIHVAKEEHGEVDAANLLLMLSKGGDVTRDCPSAITPDQFLM